MVGVCRDRRITGTPRESPRFRWDQAELDSSVYKHMVGGPCYQELKHREATVATTAESSARRETIIPIIVFVRGWNENREISQPEITAAKTI